ncbi:MAG: VOC family protein [Bacteroidia bacterium]|nr:VOC family protein [Bacteroidia bacterium]
MIFHHSGFVVKDLARSEKNLIYQEKLKEVIDPVQQARLSLYTNFSGGHIELIEPLNDQAYTWEALQKKGNHFHHFCYTVANATELNTIIEKYRLIEVLKPVPAILFDNKLVCFYYSRNKELIEFLIED